jgi:hypothetical protein
MKPRLLLTFFSLVILTFSLHCQVVINEFMASNGSVLSDENGDFSDWIELFNSGSDEIDLEGYFLSDNIQQPGKWRFPQGSVIASNGYLIVWADTKNTGLHTSFSLSRQEEEIVLSDKDTLILDSLVFYDQIYNYSYGRSSGNNHEWGYFSLPTPGSANSGEFISERCPSPVFLNPPGFYDSSLKIELVNMDVESAVYYTIDGSVPTEDSKFTSGTIQLFETAVVRVRAFKSGALPSKVVTGTYLINEASRDIDIVSVSTDPYNLWDDEYGIHVVGTNGIEAYDIVANYNQDWERPVSVELFTPEGNREFQVDAGVKISGQYSRKNEHKSLAFYMRSEYGYANLDYPLFSDKPHVKEYNNFLLRNSGSEWPETMFGDAISQYIVKDQMDTDYMAYRPAAVFLNGEYWGILNLREKINEHYPASNYRIPSDEVDMLESSGDYDFRIVSGTNSDYLALRSFFETNDMSNQQNYDYAASKVDIEHYTDYQITEIYENNTDWPGNNIKYWRHGTDPASKWRWVMYDVDRGFSIRGQAPDYEKGGNDNLVRAMTSGKYNFILPGLVNNAEYREYFIQRFNAHIYTTFHPDRVKPIFDEWTFRLENEMEHHLDRWGHARFDWGPYDEKTISGWKDIVGYKKYWTEQRPFVMMGILKEYFGLTDTFRVDLSVNSTNMGQIYVNNVPSQLESFSGVFFADVPLNLLAKPAPGYHFEYWEGISFGNTRADYSLNLTENMTLQAVFGKNSLQINEVMSDNKITFADNFGEFDDWIELYNSSESAIDIGGMYLSDNPGYLPRWRIPDNKPDSTKINPGGYLILWADTDTLQGILHVGFKLDNAGEVLTLTDRDGKTIISQVKLAKQEGGKSYGDYPDASLNRKFMPATPGYANIEFGTYDNLYINEFMASNNAYLMDEFNEFDDWIEIYNAGLEDTDLAGFYLTDDFTMPLKYQIPYGDPEVTTVPANGYLLFWADENSSQGPLHTSFKLSAAGEQIALTEPGGLYFIDSLSFGLMDSDLSFGRSYDGSLPWQQFVTATPSHSNQATFVEQDIAASLDLFPNPVKDELHIRFNDMLNGNLEISILDVQGRILLNRSFESNQTEHILNMSKLEAGVYLVRIVVGENVALKRVVKR